MEHIGALIQTVLGHTAKQQELLFTLQRQWSELVGCAMARHTKPVNLRRGRLVIHARQPGEHFTLNYQRLRLLEKLRALTDGRVDDLIVRAGDV